MTFDEIADKIDNEIDKRVNENGIYQVGVTQIEADVNDFEMLFPYIKPHIKNLTIGNITDALMLAYGFLLDENDEDEDEVIEGYVGEAVISIKGNKNNPAFKKGRYIRF